VRRFSLGATLSVSGLNLMSGGTSTVTDTPTTTTYDSKSASQRIGYGLTGQIAVTDHIAVAVGAYLRRIGYQFTTTVDTTSPVVVNGEVINIVTTTSAHEDTRARLIDVPLLVRYYSKGRHVPGPRWFIELGASWRSVRDIHTSLDSTDASGVVTCCTFTPAVPANRDARGFVGGAGFQLIDPVGIRVIPEVRYTRWLNQVFDSYTTHTAANQVEASITLAY